MDFTPVIASAYSMIAYFIPVAIILAVVKSAWFKGIFGEFLVNTAARFLLDKSKYHLIKNITLPTNDGSTQIDHIIVSEFGVFVIETKNMKGWIFGSEHQKQWTQKIFKHSSKFQNPLHQNYKHTKVLASCLGMDEGKLFSVVVFVGDSTFKTTMPENVTYAGGLIRYIKSKSSPLLSATEVHEAVNQISSNRLEPGFKTNRTHVRHIKDIQQKQADQKLCPKCGSGMVLRTAKKGANAGGQFWGCSQFPRCKLILKHLGQG